MASTIDDLFTGRGFFLAIATGEYNLSRYLLIALGAALGANARYIIGLWAGSRFGAAFPYGTFIVNVSGSLLLGFVLALATERLSLSPGTRLMLTIGFLGSFTTFSSYAVESLNLLREGGIWSGLVNIFGNNLISLIGALLGAYLARLIH